jgi:pimeloyl-ACP methyl ester carboxylesterase
MRMGDYRLVLAIVVTALYSFPSLADPPMSPPPAPAVELGQVETNLLSATVAWEQLAANPNALDADALQRYQQSICRLLHAAVCSCQLDPQTGLTLNTPAGPRTIPIRYICVPWFPEEVAALRFATVDSSAYLKRVYSYPGMGVPMLGVTKDAGMRGAAQQFLIDNTRFALTALLRPNPAAVKACLRGEAVADPIAVLELYDPLNVGCVEIAGRKVSLARDLSSALAQMKAEGENPQRFRLEFRRPGTVYEGSSLRLSRPYQPGKMPVVFVHGARSDPYAWMDLVNDLRADPEISSRYQFWVVGYSTGEPFVVSAAKMRNDCRLAQAIFNGNGADPAMSQWVLIGYSLGGQVVRLQVTYSESILWNTFSRKPPQQIRAPQDERQRLAQDFFFEPLPFVTEAIYIAGTQLGPTPAGGLVFRAAAFATHFESERQQEFRSIRRENPFTFMRIPGTFGSIPSSMDLMRRHSRFQESAYRLPNAEWVTTHDIIGTGGFAGRSDHVVPVYSARSPGAADEYFVPVKHEELHTDERTVERVRQILLQHEANFERSR